MTGVTMAAMQTKSSITLAPCSPRHFPERAPLYDPKPAYRATQTLTRFLTGCRFAERVTGPQLGSDDYVLAFRCDGETRFAAWSTSWLGRNVVLPLGPGTYRLTSVTGDSAVEKISKASGLTLSLSNTPQYLEMRNADVR